MKAVREFVQLPIPKRVDIRLEEHERQWLGKLKIYAIHDFSSCGYYRCYLPLTYLRVMGMSELRSSYEQHMANANDEFIKPQVRMSKAYVEKMKKEVEESISWADIVVMERMGTPEGLEMMRFCTKLGKPVVHESDDMCEVVPKGNPAHWYWAEAERVKLHGDCFRAADLVTTTNPRLAEFYERSYGRPTVVLENQIDYGASRWRMHYEKGPGVCIGWMGSESHAIDMETMKIFVPQILEENPDVRVEICGYMPPWAHALDRTAHVEGSIEEVPRLMRKWDIGLCPLTDHEFNTVGKSDIKFLEYSSAFIATIASNIPPYKGSGQMIHGSTCLLAQWDDPASWKAQIDRLLKSPLKRHTMTETANRLARDTRSFAVNAQRWWKAYVAVLAGKDPARACAPGSARFIEG